MATQTNRLLVLEASGETSRNNTADTIEVGSSWRTVGTGTFAFDSTGALTMSGPATVSLTPTGALTLTGGAASTWSTSAGALTITSAAAATWSTSGGALSVAGATALNLDANNGALSINATGGAIRIGNDADNQAIQIGQGGTRTITIGSGTSPVTIGGDLVVTGSTVSTSSETVLIADNHLYLNNAYATVSAVTGGLVVNYLPTATNDTVATGGFTAGVAATSNPTIATTGAATFAVSDLIQIASANNPANNGLFEVLSHAANVLTIRGIGVTATVQDFTQNQFVTDTTVAGSIRKVTVSVIRAGTDGAWETAVGSTSGLTFADLATAGGSSLQSAYEAGATITLSDAEGDLVITTDETGTVANFQVARGGGGFYFQTDASNDTAVVGSTSTATLIVVPDNLAGVFRLRETGGATNYLELDTTNAAEQLVVGAPATGTSNTVLRGGSGGVHVNVADNTAIAFRLAQSANNYIVLDTTDAAEVLTIGSTGTNAQVAVNSGTGTLNIGTSASARSVNIGTGAAVQTVTVGSTTSTSPTTIQTGTGAMTFTAGGVFDVNATGAVTVDGTGISIDGTLASNLSVTGAALTLSTITSGALDVTSAGVLDIDAASTLSINSSGGVINIGDDAVGQNLNIGTGAAARNITLGNATTTTGIAINSGTGGTLVDSTGIVEINSSGGAISIGNDANAFAINIGTGAAARTIAIGNGTGATGVTIQTGTGNLNLGTNAVAHTVAIGNQTGASAVTLDSGTGRTILDTSSTAVNAIAVRASGNGFITLDNRAEAAGTPGQRVVLGMYTSFGTAGAGVVAAAGEALSVGNVVTIKRGVTSNQIFKADADGTDLKTVAGIATQAASGSADVTKFHTLPGVIIPILMDAATTAAADEGKVVYLSATAGVGTLTAPTASGSVVFRIGLLQTAGASTTQNILFMPQFIANNP